MSKAESIRAIVFDLGGTILDFEKPESMDLVRQGLRLAYDHLGSEHTGLPAFDAYRRKLEWRLFRAYIWSRLTGTELNTLQHLAVAHRNMGIRLNESQVAEVARQIHTPIRGIAHAEPGCADALRELKSRGYPMGVISNTIASEPALDDHLSREGVLDFFPVRVYSCEVGMPKPRRRIFEIALERMGFEARTSLYVGDKPRIDVKGARRVGMMSALKVPPGQPHPPGPKPDFVISSIAGLLEILPSRCG